MIRKRLLFLCQALPYPPDAGVAIRSYNTLRLLAQRYDVTALCFYRKASLRDLPKSLEVMNRICKAQVFAIPSEHSRAQLLFDHLRSISTGVVYTRFVYESDEFRAALERELSSTPFDIAHVDSLDLSAYLPLLKGLPTVVVHHNVESSLLSRRAKVEKSIPRAIYLEKQSRLMLAEERTWCGAADLNVMVSKDDEATLRALVPGVRTLVVPNGVDTDLMTPDTCAREGIVFVGGMTWFPNKDALEWFSSEILPHLARNGPPTECVWVGRAQEQAIQQYKAKGITLTGYVEDIRPYVHRGACFIVPLRVGGGTRLKILDAWALGKAVVSTSIGCEGLNAVDGVNILIRDDPQAFAQATREVLNSPSLQEQLGKNARATAEQEYSWTVIGDAMYAHYDRLSRRES